MALPIDCIQGKHQSHIYRQRAPIDPSATRRDTIWGKQTDFSSESDDDSDILNY